MTRFSRLLPLAALALFARTGAWADRDPKLDSVPADKDECAEFKADPDHKEVTEPERTRLRDLQGACRVAQGEAAIKYIEIGNGPCTQSKELREKIEKASKYANCRTKAQTDQQKKIAELCRGWEGDGVEKDAAGKFKPTGDAQRDKRVAQCAALRDGINKKDTAGLDVEACQKAVSDPGAKGDPGHPANAFCDDVFAKHEAETTKLYEKKCEEEKASGSAAGVAPSCVALEAHKKDVASREKQRAARERELALNQRLEELTKRLDKLQTPGDIKPKCQDAAYAAAHKDECKAAATAPPKNARERWGTGISDEQAATYDRGLQRFKTPQQNDLMQRLLKTNPEAMGANYNKLLEACEKGGAGSPACQRFDRNYAAIAQGRPLSPEGKQWLKNVCSLPENKDLPACGSPRNYNPDRRRQTDVPPVMTPVRTGTKNVADQVAAFGDPPRRNAWDDFFKGWATPTTKGTVQYLDLKTGLPCNSDNGAGCGYKTVPAR